MTKHSPTQVTCQVQTCSMAWLESRPWYLMMRLLHKTISTKSRNPFMRFMRLCPNTNSTFVSVSAGSQRRSLPYVAVDFEQVALLVWEADLALLVEASFLEVVCQFLVVDPRLQHDPLRPVIRKPTVVH